MNQLRQSIPEILAQALERPEPDRPAFLEAACEGDGQVRQRVERLLAAAPKAAQFLESPAAACSPTIGTVTAQTIGSHIGPYKLLEQIGEGGMGVVFVAEQTEPVRRRVALKIIKPGMDTKQVIARFEAERQALAMMDHPHIAKVLDAGTTDAGRPYFVMELVRGLPVTEYCDTARLSPRHRLELFIDVCHAVQHAHQKGVIHRDLKPSNVMITVHDGRPVAKVIDFGVAKAVGQQLTERTLYTAHTQLVGTPLYMSPEQADFSSQDVDTRSDVYSLGVLLYELLTGQTPFDKETLTKAGFDEMRRIIREDEPPCPSRRFSTLSAQAISTVSQHRSVDERHLGRVLRGELDWIVMKALEKDRSRRYESASALAADVQRYLSDEPVLACPPTAMYRFQKFARKHKPALATAAAIALCLVLGTTVSAWQAARATTAEAQAAANEAQAKVSAQKAEEKANEATQERDQAQKRRDEVELLNSRLNKTLYIAHMNVAQHAWQEGSVERVEEILERYRPQVGQPDLRGFEWHYLNRQCNSALLKLKGDFDGVQEVAYSPDGKLIAAAGEGRQIMVWDSMTGTVRLKIAGEEEGSPCIQFSPDSTRLAAGYRTHQVVVWDVQAGSEVARFNAEVKEEKDKQTTNVWNGRPDISFSADGSRLAFAVRDFSVRVWDIKSGVEVLRLNGHSGPVAGVRFSPDGNYIATCGSSRLNEEGVFLLGELKVWDARTGALRHSLEGHQAHVRRIDFSPDGKRLASAARDQTIRIWDVETGAETLKLRLDIISMRALGLQFSPDGKRLACGVARSVKIWDAQTGNELSTIRGHRGNLHDIAFSPDGNRVVTGGAVDEVSVWDVQHTQHALSFYAAPNETGPQSFGFVPVAFSPDGKTIASGSGDQTVQFWDSKSGKLMSKLQGRGGPVYEVCYSPDGRRLSSNGKIWDLTSSKSILDFTGIGVSFSPDGKRFAFGGDEEVKIIDAETGTDLLKLDGNRLSFSPDGNRVAVDRWDNGVAICDASTGRELLRLEDSSAGPNIGSRFSPDGTLVARGSDQKIDIWNAQTGKKLHTLNGATSWYLFIAFSPDGKRLATSNELTIKLWDLQTGEEVFALCGHTAPIVPVAFSADGHRLISSSHDQTIKIWDATPLPEKP